MSDQFHPSEGRAVFGCAKGKCAKEVTVSWGAGYPALEMPSCEHGPMKFKAGDGLETVAEDELLEAEVRVELEREQAAARRLARKAEIRERLLREA